MKKNEITYIDALSAVIDNCDLEQNVMDKLMALRASLQKKATKKVDEKKAAMDDELREAVLAVLSDEGMTCTQIANAVEGLGTASKARVILSSLLDGGHVRNEMIKGKSMYFQA